MGCLEILEQPEQMCQWEYVSISVDPTLSVDFSDKMKVCKVLRRRQSSDLFLGCMLRLKLLQHRFRIQAFFLGCENKRQTQDISLHNVKSVHKSAVQMVIVMHFTKTS